MADSPFLRPGEALRDLRTLEAIEERPDISQRDLAARLGIAVGLTNACLRNMARKGLIKIKRVNSRNISYHLTPAGFAAKARLSVEYAETTIDFYRRAKRDVSARIAALAEEGVTKISVCGATDLAEIVGVVCSHSGVEVVCVVDDDESAQGKTFLGRTVQPLGQLAACGCGAVVVAKTEGADELVERTSRIVGGEVPVLKAL